MRVTVEKTWRGVTQPKPVEIYSTSYKADYELVPVADEEKYLNNKKKVEPVLLPTKIELPPLLREYVRDETGEEHPLINVHFKKTYNKLARLAQPGENPTLQVSMDLGKPKPVSSKLYEGVL